jgi:predicted nuclease with TOPRIM domain
MRITETQRANSARAWRNFVTNLEKNQKIYVSREKIEKENEFFRQRIKELRCENEQLQEKIRKLEVRSASCNQKA